jgi:hypothetical protein
LRRSFLLGPRGQRARETPAIAPGILHNQTNGRSQAKPLGLHRSFNEANETKKLRIPPLDTLLDYIQCSYCRSISKPQNHVGSAHLKNIILEDVALKCLPDPHNLRALVVG